MRHRTSCSQSFSRWLVLLLATAFPVQAQDSWTHAANNVRNAFPGATAAVFLAVAVVIGGMVLHGRTSSSQVFRSRRSTAFSVLRYTLFMALSAGPAYGAGDMVSNFLTSVVSLITSTWAIAIVVIATFYVGYLFFFSDRRTHEHLSGWLFGCIFVLGCQVLAQQFIH
jgi:type IV secretory pathway VirB2 component (pilin)